MFCFCFSILLLFDHACALYATENNLLLGCHKHSPQASYGIQTHDQDLTQKYSLDFIKRTKKNGLKMPFQSGFRASYYSPENFDFYVGFNKPITKKADGNNRNIIDHIETVPKPTLFESLTSGRWAQHVAFGVTMTF